MSQILSQEEIIQKVKESDSRNVKIAVTDIDGVLRGKYVHIDKFLSAVKSGLGFCDVIFGWDCTDTNYGYVDLTGSHTGFPDKRAVIDLSTYRRIPWDQQMPFFLADFINEDGTSLYVCPRQLLRKIIQKTEGLGFHPSFGMEFEWFNFKETSQSLYEKKHSAELIEPLTPGMFGYSVLRASQNGDYFRTLMTELQDFDIPIEGIHTETGPGVYEVAILYSDALTCADRGTLFKASVKEIAARFGIMPTFMAKWNHQLPGCSGHLHQSLWNAEKTENLFHQEDAKSKMSPLFRNYLAGQLKCLPEILPLFAPTINSYKRLVEGMWAPTLVTWGVDNRTTSLRVIPGSSSSTRLETRVSGSDVNPYLAVSAALASGMYGVEKGLPLELPEVKGNGYNVPGAEKLPKNLEEATHRMMDSRIANEILGEAFVKHYGQTRLWEVKQFQSYVTNWELKRYFEII